MNLSGKNVFVTGGTGFVGAHLVEDLVNLGANVLTTHLDLDPNSYFFTQGLHKKVKMVNLNVCNFDSVFDTIVKFETHYIFHLAAQALVGVAYHNPRQTLLDNIVGTINILESVRLYPKIEGVIVASSDKAYGKVGRKKYQEDTPLRGDHPYEVSKSAADLICTSYFKTYNIPVVITRFGNIYGEGDMNFSRIIPGAMSSLIKNEKLEIRSNGRHVRDYLYVKDVVKGYLLLAENIKESAGEAYNFGSKDTINVLRVLEIMQNTLDKKIDFVVLNTAKNEIPYQSLDYSKIKETLGWEPQYSLADGIKNSFGWYSDLLKNPSFVHLGIKKMLEMISEKE